MDRLSDSRLSLEEERPSLTTRLLDCVRVVFASLSCSMSDEKSSPDIFAPPERCENHFVTSAGSTWPSALCKMRLTSGPAAASVDIGADGNALPVPSHAAGGLLKPAPSPHQLLPRCDCGEAVAAEKELFVCRKLPV